MLEPETRRLESNISRMENLFENKGTQTFKESSKEMTYVRNQKVLRKFFAPVPYFNALPDLIKELFDYAKKLGLTIEQVNYHPKNLTELHMVLYGLSFQLEGSYDQIKHMVFLLENSPRIIAINKVQFQRRSTQSKKVVLGLDLETYFKREEPQ